MIAILCFLVIFLGIYLLLKSYYQELTVGKYAGYTISVCLVAILVLAGCWLLLKGMPTRQAGPQPNAEFLWNGPATHIEFVDINGNRFAGGLGGGIGGRLGGGIGGRLGGIGFDLNDDEVIEIFFDNLQAMNEDERRATLDNIRNQLPNELMNENIQQEVTAAILNNREFDEELQAVLVDQFKYIFRPKKTVTEMLCELKTVSGPKEGECGICYDNLDEGELLECPKCTKLTHHPCLKQWLESGQNVCIYCRQNL